MRKPGWHPSILLMTFETLGIRQVPYKIVLKKGQEVEKEVEICISQFEWNFFLIAQLCLDL